jgi:hypothetical protein
MVHEEFAIQHAEVAGEQTTTCDGCGTVVAPPDLELVDRELFSLGVRGDVDYVWLCPDCWKALQEGTLQIDVDYL